MRLLSKNVQGASSHKTCLNRLLQSVRSLAFYTLLIRRHQRHNTLVTPDASPACKITGALR